MPLWEVGEELKKKNNIFVVMRKRVGNKISAL